MLRYFFDIHDGHSFHHDSEGIAFASFAEARVEAMRALPEIARFALPKNGDNQAYTVLVRDEQGSIVYTATLTYAGLKLNDEAPHHR